MNKDIGTYYLSLIKSGNVDSIDVNDALLVGIRLNNVTLVKKCLELLEKIDSSTIKDEYPYAGKFAIKEMASPEIMNLLSEAGYEFYIASDSYFVPSIFSFTPKEMLAFIEKTAGKDKNPLSVLMDEVGYYFHVYKEGVSNFRVPFYIDKEDIYKPYFFSYMDAWCNNLATIIVNEEDKEENLLQLLCIASNEPRFIKTFDRVIAFLSKEQVEKNLDHYLNLAIRSGNERAFEFLIENFNVDGKDIDRYPPTSKKILDKMFELNLLTPGSENAYLAFQYYIMGSENEIDHEILSRIMHPSYSRRRDEYWGTPLYTAIHNEDFPVEEYKTLINSKDDLEFRDENGETAIFQFAYTDYPECMEELINLGANPYVKDNNGNNVGSSLFVVGKLHNRTKRNSQLTTTEVNHVNEVLHISKTSSPVLYDAYL